MTVEEFIEELKPMVTYDKAKRIHMMGSTILTNMEVKHMLHIMLGEDYDNLSKREQTIIKRRVFDETRGVISD